MYCWVELLGMGLIWEDNRGGCIDCWFQDLVMNGCDGGLPVISGSRIGGLGSGFFCGFLRWS